MHYEAHENPRIVVVVRGGVVQEIYSDTKVEAVLVDFDNYEDPDGFSCDIFPMTGQTATVEQFFSEAQARGHDEG